MPLNDKQTMKPLRVHETDSDFFGDETVELRVSLRTYLHAGRLKEYPGVTEAGVREHLIRKLNKLIDETDFTNIVCVYRSGGKEGDYAIE